MHILFFSSQSRSSSEAPYHFTPLNPSIPGFKPSPMLAFLSPHPLNDSRHSVICWPLPPLISDNEGNRLPWRDAFCAMSSHMHQAIAPAEALSARERRAGNSLPSPICHETTTIKYRLVVLKWLWHTIRRDGLKLKGEYSTLISLQVCLRERLQPAPSVWRSFCFMSGCR